MRARAGELSATSLGVMLFEMLAGRLPFEAGTAGDLIAMHITCDPPDLGACAPTVSLAMVELVGSMLAKLPSTRPSMRAVEERLAGIERQLLAGTATSTRTRQQRGQLVRWGAVGLATLSLAIGGWRLARLRAQPGLDRPPLAAQPSAISPPPAMLQPSAAPASSPAPTVSWAIRTLPAGARIVRTADQVLVGITPWQDRAPRGEGDLEVAIELAGFRPQRLLLSHRQDTAWELPLQPLGAETRPAGGPARHAAPAPLRSRVKVAHPVGAPAEPPDSTGTAGLPAAAAAAAAEPPAAAPAPSQPPPPSPSPAPARREQPHDDDVEVPALH